MSDITRLGLPHTVMDIFVFILETLRGSSRYAITVQKSQILLELTISDQSAEYSHV